MTNDDLFTLHCKVIEGEAYTLPCVGFEDLSDVLEDLARLHVATGFPPSPVDCEYWALHNGSGTEFAVAGVVPYGVL